MIPGPRPRKFLGGVYFCGKDLNLENIENFHVYSITNVVLSVWEGK